MLRVFIYTSCVWFPIPYCASKLHAAKQLDMLYCYIPNIFFLPLSQAVRRIVARDGVSKEDALRRLQSQWSNAKMVAQANVVLCTLWEPDVTQKQVHSPEYLHLA